MRLCSRILIIFISTAWSLSTGAEPISSYVVDKSLKSENLGPYLQYLVDPNAQKTITHFIPSAPNTEPNNTSIQWMPSHFNIPSFGYTSDIYWFRLRLTNPHAKSTDKLLAIEYPLLDLIDIYLVKNDQINLHTQYGDTLPFSSRTIHHRSFLLPVQLPANDYLDVYIRVSTQGSLQLPVSLVDERHFFETDQQNLASKNIYYGMLLVMVLYNLFLYFSLKEKAYLYYVNFVCSFLLMQAAMHGVLFQFVYPDAPSIHQVSILVLVPMTMLFACLFTRDFLNLNVNAIWLDRVLLISTYLSLLCIAGAFFLNYGISTQCSVFLVIIASLTIMISGPYVWIRGVKSAKYFTVAWIFLVLGTTVAAINKFGLLPRNSLTENGLQWGSAMEAVLLSFALADRLNRERQARFKAQRDKLIEIQHREVAEEQLLHQATHHPQSGLPNMAFLRKRLDAKLPIDDKENLPFTLVLIHLSNFQEINKTIGHMNADLLIQLFSERLASMLMSIQKRLFMESENKHSQYIASFEGISFAFLIQSQHQDWINAQINSILPQLSAPIDFEGMKIDVGVVAGFAMAPVHSNESYSLIRYAQIAIDAAGEHNGYVGKYSDDINPYSARRLGLMGALREALNNQALELYYQPQYSYQKDQFYGLEALLRWNHLDLGFIAPDEFIPIAEKNRAD